MKAEGSHAAAPLSPNRPASLNSRSVQKSEASCIRVNRKGVTKKSRSMKCPYLYYMVARPIWVLRCRCVNYRGGVEEQRKQQRVPGKKQQKRKQRETRMGKAKLSQSSESDLGVVEVKDGVDVLHERVTKKSC